MKVSEPGETVPSDRSRLVTGMVTSPVGGAVRTTVKLAAKPVSAVFSPLAGVTTKLVGWLPKFLPVWLPSVKEKV